LLKDIITIFYAPLATVYKAASIADSLGDLQNFMNDMIRTIEQVDESESKFHDIGGTTDQTASQQDPSRTVQTFIDLVQRHEQAFYTFVHNVHSKGSGLFDSLMAWIELFLSYARDGLPQPVDLEFLLPDSGPQRQAIMAEVDAVAQYHYRLKVAHEEKIRRRFEKGPPGDLDVVTGIEESDEAEILDTVMSGLRIDDTAVDMIDDDSSSDDEDDDEDEDVDSDHETKPHGHKDSPLLAPVPERFGPNAERDRRGSNSSTGKSGFHRIKHSIDFSRSSPTPDQSTSKVPDTPRRSPRPKMSKKKRRRLLAEAEIAPETKAIEEMRPLFMEIVSLPLLSDG
jgi:hypothetical protein